MSTSKRRDLQRLLAKIERDTQTGCWNWTASIAPSGYAQFRFLGRRDYGHRAAYVLLVGPIPDGLHLDHLCRNRPCVNPAHLEPVAPQINTLRSPIAPASINAAKSHCAHGHLLHGDNVYQRPDRIGRMCRTCRREVNRLYRMKRAA